MSSKTSPLLPFCYLLSPNPCDDSNHLLEASRLIDYLATEAAERHRCSRQVIIYNVSDKIPAIKAAKAVLHACGLNQLNDQSYRVRRLKKASPKVYCPLVIEFEHAFVASELLSKRNELTSKPDFRNIRICPTRTPLQRELASKPPFDHSGVRYMCNSLASTQNSREAARISVKCDDRYLSNHSSMSSSPSKVASSEYTVSTN